MATFLSTWGSSDFVTFLPVRCEATRPATTSADAATAARGQSLSETERAGAGADARAWSIRIRRWRVGIASCEHNASAASRPANCSAIFLALLSQREQLARCESTVVRVATENSPSMYA